MAGHHLGQRHMAGFGLGHGLLEGGRLADPQSHPQAQADQDGAGQERQAPTPGLKILGGQQQAQQQEQAVGGDEPHRRAQLGEHAEPGAPAGRRVLHRQQGRPAPLAAQSEPLAEPEHAQQRRRHPPDHGVGRQKGDQEGRHPHHHQRGHQRGLAPDPVAEMAKERRADRPGEEGHGEGRIALQQLGRVRRLGEEQLREHQRGGGRVDVEVVELHRRADQAGGQHPAGRGAWRGGFGCGHARPSGAPRLRLLCRCGQAAWRPGGFAVRAKG